MWHSFVCCNLPCLSELFCLFATALLRLAVSPTTELMLWRTLFTALFIPDFSLFSRVAVDTFRGESTAAESTFVIISCHSSWRDNGKYFEVLFFQLKYNKVEKYDCVVLKLKIEKDNVKWLLENIFNPNVKGS